SDPTTQLGPPRPNHPSPHSSPPALGRHPFTMTWMTENLHRHFCWRIHSGDRILVVTALTLSLFNH
uniref:Uncharacterized protein n=1 Tax=Monopterus albus TaxID=43700 RepID=A0A3Q3JM15_MONAL